MNSIKAITDKSEYGYGNYLNYSIDGYWLDEKLEELYPGNFYGGTVPTLIFGMELKEEERVVWQRILPEEGTAINCPILMCPDDNDFSCTLIIAEILSGKKTIKWSRLGIDRTTDYDPDKVGSSVEWFEGNLSFEFLRTDYLLMLDVFKEQFDIDKRNWRKTILMSNN